MTEFWLKKINEYWDENELTEKGMEFIKGHLAESGVYEVYSASALRREAMLSHHASKEQVKELKLWLKKAKKDWDEKGIYPVDTWVLPISKLDPVSELKESTKNDLNQA